MRTSASPPPIWAVAFLLLALAVSCGDRNDATEGLHVVATTTIIGDLAANILGSHGTVEAILPPEADPHDYAASPQQVAALQRADLVIANGLDLEEGLLDILAAAREDGVQVIELGPAVDPLITDDGTPDPHFWLDPTRAVVAVDVIAGALAGVDPSVDWASAAGGYRAEILAADQRIEAQLEGIAEERRTLVTNHDSLAYFADRYGFEVVGTVIPGTTTTAAPNAADLAALVDLIEQLGVNAIFADVNSPTDVADAVAAEVGRPIAVVALFTGSLGPPESGAESFVGMLEENARRISEALE